MKFVKILNNNIAIVADEAGEDRIVMGCGVAFGKKYGDPVDMTRIERIFTQNVRDLSGKFEALLKEIPDEYLECADRIIAHGKLLLGKELADNLYLSLTDHIFFTVKRCREGMLIHNRLLFETKMIYKEEFQVGMDAVEMMNQQFEINLPEDEAAFLALHFVNATMGTEMNKPLEITKIVQEIRTIIRNFFRIEFQEDSLSYYRMMTHLKFFAQRMALHEGKSDQNADLQLFQMVKERYGQSYRCVERIVEYLQKQYHYTVSDNEKLYLTIHIERIHQN